MLFLLKTVYSTLFVLNIYCLYYFLIAMPVLVPQFDSELLEDRAVVYPIVLMATDTALE